MVIEVELRVPAPVPEDLRRRVLAITPREGEDCCSRCGVDRFHLVDALLDPHSWENRGLAAFLLEGCAECRAAVAELLARAAQPATPASASP